MMAAHSSVLAWRIPRTEESMGSQRVGHGRETHTQPIVQQRPRAALQKPELAVELELPSASRPSRGSAVVCPD